MLVNGNNYAVFNDFSELAYIPYKMIELLLTETSEQAENLWKLLKYGDVNCLEKDNLTFEEKKKMVWQGDSIEQDYSVFIKPLVGSAMDTAEAQTQIRLYRYNTMPTNRLEAVVCFEIDLITNEKTSLVMNDGILMERTDLMEVYFLDIMNGRDINIGSDYFRFDRTLSRSCNSQLNIGNSKSFYGRSLIMGLMFANSELGSGC